MYDQMNRRYSVWRGSTWEVRARTWLPCVHHASCILDNSIDSIVNFSKMYFTVLYAADDLVRALDVV
jgi:hypothetical protein